MTELIGRKALSHERILDTAARAVRRLGFQGVNVADVMREAGLTHGGFYAHFRSRNALLSEAVARAGTAMAERMHELIARRRARGTSALGALLDSYLSMEHVRDLEQACPVSVLCGEVARQAPEIIEPSRRLIVNLQQLVADVLPRRAGADVAWTVTSAIVGAVQLARALGEGAAARAVLADTRSNLMARYG